MNTLKMEIRFEEGKYKGQIWSFENLDIDDILDHYDSLPFKILLNADIYIESQFGIEEISAFLKTHMNDWESTNFY